MDTEQILRLVQSVPSKKLGLLIFGWQKQEVIILMKQLF